MKNSEVQNQVVFFRTSLEWMGLGYHAGRIQKLSFGNETRLKAAAQFDPRKFEAIEPNEESQPWIDQLNHYSDGVKYDFAGLPLNLDSRTDFQLAVIAACRQIPHGQTVSYLELAKLAGFEGAARAVGSVMSRNAIPLIIPCHRVISSNGLGGFSAAAGVTSKQRLLKLEGYLKDIETQKELAL
jgi:methylated-DNA-[protein]-cysteine S-methyltransferase